MNHPHQACSIFVEDFAEQNQMCLKGQNTEAVANKQESQTQYTITT